MHAQPPTVAQETTHCSSLFKLMDGDTGASHDTWSNYWLMLRVYKQVCTIAVVWVVCVHFHVVCLCLSLVCVYLCAALISSTSPMPLLACSASPPTPPTSALEMTFTPARTPMYKRRRLLVGHMNPFTDCVHCAVPCVNNVCLPAGHHRDYQQHLQQDPAAACHAVCSIHMATCNGSQHGGNKRRRLGRHLPDIEQWQYAQAIAAV